MQLKRIEIINFKGIVNSTFDFSDGFNIIIGDNGVGKTSILEAISVALGGFIAGTDANTKHFSNSEIRRVSELLGEGSYNQKYITPIQVTSTVDVNGPTFTWTRKKNSIKSARSTIEPRNICKEAARIVADSFAVLPVLSYQSAARMWSQKRDKTENVFREDFSRTVGYIDCLSDAANAKMLLNWCRKMEQISWQEDKKIAEYESVKKALANFIDIMCGGESGQVFYSKRTEELVYSHEKETLPIGFLSAGYQSAIWMVLDIAYRMAILNPNLKHNVTDETSGVVLIDEIDLHLHPNWQWNIVNALHVTFPKVQFIVTTHSPIIIASCKNENLIMIDSDMNIDYTESAYGYQINHVLTHYQKSDDRISGIGGQFKAFYEAIDEEKLSDARLILEKLKEIVNENDPDFVNARVTLDLEAIPLGE